MSEIIFVSESDERPPSLKKRFAIDLRTPEEIEAAFETEA